MLIDSGAQRSIISKSFAENIKISYQNSDACVRPIGNNIISAQITGNIEVQVCDKIVTMKFAVIPVVHVKVLLGADWLILTDARTWLSRQLLWYGDDEIINLKEKTIERNK